MKEDRLSERLPLHISDYPIYKVQATAESGRWGIGIQKLSLTAPGMGDAIRERQPSRLPDRKNDQGEAFTAAG